MITLMVVLLVLMVGPLLLERLERRVLAPTDSRASSGHRDHERHRRGMIPFE